jgi:leucyl aminopeptidase
VNVQVSDCSPQDVTSQVFIAGMYEGDKPSESGLGRLDALLGNRIERAISTGDFSARRNQVLELYGGQQEGPRHILLVGLGPRKKCVGECIRRFFGSAGKRARASRWNDVTVLPPLVGFNDDEQRSNTIAALEGVALAMYRYVRQSRHPERYPHLESLQVIGGDDANAKSVKAGAAYADATIDGVTYARDLVCMPAGDLYPESYAKIANELEGGSISVEVLDEKKLAKLKMGAILAVGQGSKHPPCIIHLTYEPKKVTKKTKTFALVGKGLTFDSGGLNIKSSAGIRDMKVDMGGSATVMGVFKAIDRVKPKCRVHGFIAAVENMTDGAAYHPGDVLTAYNGLTIEVDNTDAEGRLALADTLAYTADVYKPDAMIDLATLTGAVVVALGHYCTGVMSNNDELVDLITTASRVTGERTWRMPLWNDYAVQIRSEIADLKNTGGSSAGSITAGKFLQEFVGDIPWAHMDIAGTATDGPYSYTPHKELGTGVGVRLLLEALQQWA